MSGVASEAPAWLLSLGGGQRAIVADAHIVHLLVIAPSITRVLGSAAHCLGVFAWNDRLVPALDLHCWMHGEALDADHAFYAVLAVRDADSGEALVAAVLLDDIPARLRVSDGDARDLCDVDSALRVLALSAIDVDGDVLPILDVAALLARPLPVAKTRVAAPA